MNQTATLADYAVNISMDEIPDGVLAYAKLLLLDQLGCQTAGARQPWGHLVRATAARWSAPGPATVIASSEKLSPDGAAFINGTFGHGHETDDTHESSPTHPGAVVFPAVMAIAEAEHIDGARTLEAIVAAYEVTLRIGYAVSPFLLRQGHHPPPAVGPFGVAAGVGHLLGISHEDMVAAFGIAGSYSSGLHEFTQSGGSVKRLHGGIPAQAGIRAVQLAIAGITGPTAVLEGTRGFCRVFGPGGDISWLDRDLGTRFLLPETSIKVHSCCFKIQPMIEALRQFQQSRPFKAEEVQSLAVVVKDATAQGTIGTIRRPIDILGAQFSAPYCAALYLTRGRCHIDEFRVEDLANPELLRIADRVRVEVGQPDQGGTVVRLALHDGEQFEVLVDVVPGEPALPLGRSAIEDKFRSMMEGSFPAGTIELAASRALQLEESDDVSNLMSLMSRD